MSLVVKSWRVQSQPVAGQPYVQVVARRSGLFAFIMSLLGIDATTTLVVTSQGFEFEQGSLSGFVRRLTPFDHVSSVFYGRFKPWKFTAFLIFLALSISTSLMGHTTGLTVVATIIMFGGIGGALLYYFLNRQLTIGFYEDSGHSLSITFTGSAIEGQEIDEDAMRKLIVIVEALMRGTESTLASVSAGGTPLSLRMAQPAPTSLSEVISGESSQGAVSLPLRTAKLCSSCRNPLSPTDVFCGVCGTRAT